MKSPESSWTPEMSRSKNFFINCHGWQDTAITAQQSSFVLAHGYQPPEYADKPTNQPSTNKRLRAQQLNGIAKLSHAVIIFTQTNVNQKDTYAIKAFVNYFCR